MEAQIFQKVAQNVVTVVFTLKWMFFEYPNQWPKRLDTFEGNFVTQSGHSGCDRAVTFNSSDLRFESRHRQIRIEKTKINEKEAGNAPI